VAIWFPVAVAHAVIVALLIWAAYGFRYEAMKGAVSGRDRLYTFSPPPPGVDAWSHEVVGLGAIGRVIAWFRQHGLLPEAYLYGLVSTQKHIQEVPVFLNGEIHADGCWYFLPYCFAVKTALPLLALLLLALWGGGAAKARRQHVEGVAHRFSGGGANSATIASPTAEAMGHPDPAAEAMGHPDCGDGLSHTISRWRAIGQGAYRTAPLWSLLLVYTVFAIGSRVSLGHRHLLPIYPVLFIFAGRAVIWLRSPRPLAGWAALSAAGLFIGASLSVWPDYLAYFNYAAGGPADGYKHLVDSSLDWGQDLPGLRRWLDRQMGAAGKRAAAGSRPPVYLAYFGTGSPGFYGIRARTLMRYPGWDAPWASPLSGGIYCISATLLQQFHLMPVSKWTPALEACYQELDRGTPASRPNPSTRGAGSAGPAGLSGAELGLYLRLRFARLCACLRQRSPDHEIGHSILIYRLTDDDVRQALEGPPAESEPDSVHQLRDLAEWCFAGGCLRSAGVLYGEWARRLESLGPNPERADGMANYAACLASSGREADAVQAIRQGLRCDPNHVGMNTQLAWLLAGSRSDALRDGPEALRRATKAVEETGGRQPMVLASLAAAYAELGRFEEACRHAQDALRIAQDKRMTVPARQIAAQLELYRSGKPYRAL
jgi:tetratricopeptide (TPR) repeat protein